MTRIESHPLPHHNERPPWSVVDTVIIHSMFAVDYKEPDSVENCIAALDKAEVASHYLIGRNGEGWRLVTEDQRAWHAGESCLLIPDGKFQGVNDFSIGIELICTNADTVTEEQYHTLGKLLVEVLSRHPIRFIFGHEHVAVPQGRKSDPGTTFCWKRFKSELESNGIDLRNLTFPDTQA